MPHINRIRVNNVKYNFGTQFYDDFIMRFDGKNALYDLANGGGKSVLMLLLLQNLIPNCTLDDKQPIEKLFRTGEGSTTIHSLIEWKLDEYLVEDDFKYMLTGFCARKAREDSNENVKDAASIDYFNYVIFYREYNDNDIINLPLSNARERITYSGLKAYLKELGSKDYSLKIATFDRKGEYQQFISRYGLYESEWEIIRGINKTEGHVRTYFETNYRTTRKVVEDLLIEKIIQKAFTVNTGGKSQEDEVAQTLLNIKDKLLDLSLKKEEIHHFDRQIEILEAFKGRINTLDNLYESQEVFYEDLVKTYNTIIAVIKQKEKENALFSKEKELTLGHVEDLLRKLETVKVQIQRERLMVLEKDTAGYESEIRNLEETYEKNKTQLHLKESINDYIEYIQYEKKCETIRQMLNNVKRDNKELLAVLNQYAYWQKQFFNKESAELRSLMEETKKNQRDNMKQLEELLHCQRELDKEIAVTSNNIDIAKEQEEDAIRTIGRLRKGVNALLVEGSEKEIRANKINQKNCREKLADYENSLSGCELSLKELNERKEKSNGEYKAAFSKQEEFQLFFEQYDQKKEKADKLKEIYNVSDYTALRDLINKRYKKLIVDFADKRKEADKLNKYRKQLNDKNPLMASEQIMKIAEYIRRCHGVTCILGSDYLHDLEKEEKEALLWRIPFLPYSIILKTDYERVAGDHHFKEIDFGDYAVPILSLETVMSDESMLDEARVMFCAKNRRLFLDEKELNKQITTTKKALDTLVQEIKRLEDNEETYTEDLGYLNSFMIDYHEKYVDCMSKMQETRKRIDKSSRDFQELEEEIYAKEQQVIDLKEKIELEQITLKDLEESQAILESIFNVNKQLAEWEKMIAKSRLKKEQLEKQYKSVSREFAECTKRQKELSSAFSRYAQQADEIQDNWQNNYSLYDVEGDYEAVSWDSETLDAKFKGIKSVFENEHTDLDDKNNLLLSYEKGAERAVKAIADRGISLEQLKQMSGETRLIQIEEGVIESLKDSLTALEEKISQQKRLLEQSKEDKNKLFGSVENATSVVEEKYGAFKEVDLKNMDYETFMEEHQAALVTMKDRLSQAETKMDRGMRRLRALEDHKREVERLIRQAQVKYSLTGEAYELDLDIPRKLEKLVNLYNKLYKDELHRKDEFSKAKETAAATLSLLKAYELADEIRTHVEVPKNRNEAILLIANIDETGDIIRLEKERVNQGILDMVLIKENFESQCLQQCNNIKMELDKLSKLSKITLYGEQIQIINLSINYIKEDLRKQYMSEYIDKIVKNCDTYKDYNERLKYIRNQLAWKNLFSVIVTDMNSIRLNLYKRERIKEQSRYLKYEEAVGSTGQSQGIYIQFLIGIINYISSIYAGNIDYTKLKKVIFIDNPFGAAKDIYIWEPIFRLLETNNVQLIVPARGATPAISGRFDVNYVLGQKLIDNKQQTVVVDFHSNVDITEVEYVKIEYEQEVFDFI